MFISFCHCQCFTFEHEYICQVGAAAAFLPKDLATQLRVGGRMVIPIGPRHGVQALYKIDRCGGDDTKQPGVYREEDFRVEELMSVRYVPLVDAETIS
mmetsp:Transcript_33261/g.48889  ORF Transcript_33261/g.48889 Transcript_33261/m.48889 type:complete len:98 (+) Transcript_33261:5-298(+)